MVDINKYKDWILLISICCSLVTLWVDVPGLDLLFLLPLCYGVCLRLLVPDNAQVNAGLLILFLVLSFRYLLYPILLFIAYEPIPNVQHYGQEAICYMLVEILAIFLTIYHTCKANTVSFSLLEEHKVNYHMLLILFIVSMGFVALGNDMMEGKHFVWETDAIIEEVTYKNSGVASQVFAWFQAFFMIYFVNYFAQKYWDSNRNVFYVLSVLICFMPCLLYSGHSRLSLLIPLVASCALIYKVYGSKSKIAISTSLIGGGCVLILLSVVKSFRSTEGMADADDLFVAPMINAYFEGIENVIVGLRAYEHFGINTSWLIWDSLSNAMGISGYFEFSPGTSKAFNEVLYGGAGLAYDQIVPTIASGMMYFGQFLFFIPTVVMTYVVCKCDAIFARTKSIEYAYLYSNFPIIVAWAVPGSWMHLTGRFFNFYLPILFLIFLNNRISKR